MLGTNNYMFSLNPAFPWARERGGTVTLIFHHCHCQQSRAAFVIDCFVIFLLEEALGKLGDASLGCEEAMLIEGFSKLFGRLSWWVSLLVSWTQSASETVVKSGKEIWTVVTPHCWHSLLGNPGICLAAK